MWTFKRKDKQSDDELIGAIKNSFYKIYNWEALIDDKKELVVLHLLTNKKFTVSYGLHGNVKFYHPGLTINEQYYLGGIFEKVVIPTLLEEARINKRSELNIFLESDHANNSN